MFKHLLVAIPLCLMQSFSVAQEFPRSSIPDPLKSWVPWVLDQQVDLRCPHYFDNGDTRSCQWPGVLDLRVNSKGADFTQTWQVYADTWISLPGDERHWPQDALVDGKALPVISRDGVPSIRLQAGSFKVTGRFIWTQIPESLGLAVNSGLLHLELNGNVIAHPVRDYDNRVWLQKKQEISSVDQTTLKVFRKIKDGIPVVLETRFHLEVSGKAREVNLGRALLPGLIPQALNSNLTASLNQEGNLLVQARPGNWDISFVSRLPTDLKSLSLPAGSGLLTDEEVWVYEANPSVRMASVEGPAAIDVQQTTLPNEWRSLPAYLMRPVSSQFSLKQIRRGDSEPNPDRLQLQRNMWLSFDGKDMTVSDNIGGNMSRPARLNLVPSALPGRIEVNGQDQQISSGSDKLAGVEVQGGSLSMSADSRLPLSSGSINATLWKHDLDSLSMNLHLPPGWRLLHASGVDQAQGAWLSSWNLLDFFLVLITALVAAHLWGKKWGVIALLCLVLSYQELDAPRSLWIVCFALIAVYRVLPEGKMKLVAQWLQRASVLALLVLSLGFATLQVRSAIYPVLENDGFLEHRRTAFVTDHRVAPREQANAEMGPAEPPVAPAEPAEAPPAPPMELAYKEVIVSNAPAPAYIPPPEVRVLARQKMSILREEDKQDGYISSLSKNAGIDPDAKVQTGPGLPSWQWRSHELRFDGPVTQEQEIHLWLLSPSVLKVLAVLRLVLLALVLLCVAQAIFASDRSNKDQGGGDVPGADDAASLWLQLKKHFQTWAAPSKKTLTSGLSVLLLGLFVQMAIAPDLRAQTPSEEQLHQLREKLTRKAECLPECAEISRLTVQVSGTTVRLNLDVDAAIDTSLPLPGGKKSWLPNQARLDGKTAYVDRDGDGMLSFLVPAGRHRLELVGELLQSDTLQLPLPRKPRRVDVEAPGWDIAGISEETGAEDTIQLSRQVKLGKDAKKNAEAEFPALLRVHRTLYFMKEWSLETVVERLSPKGAPVLAQIALLEGEAVNTAGINVKDGQVLLNMGPQSDRLTWNSSLKQVPQLSLKASDQCAESKVAHCLEKWSVLSNNIWHPEFKGIPPMMGTSNGVQSFLPWAGESLEIKIERPQAVAGQTLTIDQSYLTATPGARASDYRLFMVLRSSRGLEHSLDLPQGAVLQKVTINGIEFPIRAVGQKLSLPIKPGRQEVDIRWRVERGVGLIYRNDSVKLGLPSVNSKVEVNLPSDRWLLAVGGEGMGPAILFWSKLILLLLLAIALGRVSWIPVSRWQWILFALGMTQLSWLMILAIVTWFYAFAYRARINVAIAKPWQLNLRQMALIIHSVLFFVVVLEIIRGGLLGHPDMQVSGNDSFGNQLSWYQDRIDGSVQSVWVLSMPMILYRGLMLLWALWLASSIIPWVKWAWNAFSTSGVWKSKAPKQQNTDEAGTNDPSTAQQVMDASAPAITKATDMNEEMAKESLTGAEAKALSD